MQRNDFEMSGMIRARQDDLQRERRHRVVGQELRAPRPAGTGRVRRAIGRRMVAVGMALAG